ncbi:MAG TPA: putative lipid II flippase FtsW [Candidatus Magasanikbacteria bacterium]|nr:putative lipid II flippase FtsW [Candidatus Magasanikbacteria bacterium]
MPRIGNKNVDYALVVAFGVLLIFGLVILTSASSAVGSARFSDSYYFVKKQLLFGVLPGIIAFLVCSRVSYLFWRRWSTWIYGFAILLLIAVFIPGFGANYGTHAHSWLSILGFSFQPAEFAKLALVVFMASLLATRGPELRLFANGFLPALLMGGIVVVLTLLQPDVGTVVILFGILFTMLFTADTRPMHIAVLALLGIAGLCILVFSADYRADRLMAFMHPELDPRGVGYHTNQALLAVGTGGLFGKGLGNSVQKFQYLPEVAADSIYAVLVEELGFVAGFGLLLFWLFITARVVRMAKNAPDEFSRLLVTGIISWFLIQSFMNIGAMLGLMPLTGVPLPFISHGGTALMLALGAAGILVSVSRETK